MKLIPNALSVKLARQALLSQKNSPAILFAAGVAGMTCSTILACRATLRLEETLYKAQTDLALARSLDHEEYSEMDRKKDTAVIYVRSAVSVGQLYAPAVLLGAASISALTVSHNILNSRNLALTAAYAALERGFGEYRERVIDKYGEDQDREFRYSTELVETSNKKGKSVKQLRVSSDEPSIYARFFDPTSSSWNRDPEVNLLFLRAQQNYANDRLGSRGHVFLNEVYDLLGMERSRAGQVVGWVRNGEGDNFIDFGVFDDKDMFRDFFLGREKSILLDFNVDGVIWDKLASVNGMGEYD